MQFFHDSQDSPPGAGGNQQATSNAIRLNQRDAKGIDLAF